MSRLNKGLFTSASQHWATPTKLYDFLWELHKFTDDPCPLQAVECDGLTKRWGERVYCNPPYGREISKWLLKGRYEITVGVTTKLIVWLLPARTDTKWFHDIVFPLATKIEFLRGRLHFNNVGPAPFPSMIVTWERDKQ